MKRLLSLFLFLMTAMLSFAHDFEVKNADEKTIYYEITSSSNLTVAVTYQGTSYSEYMDEYTGSVTIPDKVTYNGKTYSVTSIGDDAFRNCTGLTSVTIPNSVTNIGNYAFRNCSSLTSVTIPNSVTSIGNYAFYYCYGLTSITIPNSVTSIGDKAFYACSSLTKVIVPDIAAWCNILFSSSSANPLYYVKHIYSDENNEITDLVIPNSVTSIGSRAFEGCSGLTSVTIPNSVTSIGSSAFSGCSGLTSVTIPNSVTSIGISAFESCSSLTLVTIPNSVTSIGSSAFDGCSGLTSVTIPNSVTSIGNSAFDGCSGLTSVTIGNSVTSIGSMAFYGCSGLTSVTIGNSVTSIGGSAFFDCSGLKKVIVPDIAAWCEISFSGYAANPLYYAKHIFSDENTEITDLVIPNSVTSIGDYAFDGCSGLTSVTIGNSVTSIGSSAFAYCSGLTSVTIPNSVTSIGGSAFYNCSGLTSVEIPNGVTSIGRSAFCVCSSLTSITIPNSVTSIGDDAFYITAWYNNQPEGLIYLGKVAYKYKGTMPKNTAIDLEEGTTEIANEAFYNCYGLTSITIPNSVTSIGDHAFCNCSGLTSITIPNSVSSIGGSAFAGCSGMTSVTIGNSVTSIGDCAFFECSGLTSVTIPNSVTTIGIYAFYNCRSLTSVTIPNSVTSIGEYAFYACSSLKEITSYIQEPFQTGDYCWDLVNKSIPLYVPAGTKEKYQSTGGWKDFTNIIEFGGERIEPLTEPQEVDVAVVPDQISLNGMVVGNTYYVLDADNGDGADSENGCVVIITTTNDEAIDGIAGKDISDASVKAVFKGIIFMVPAGTGTVSINAETLGTSSLMVKIGSQAAQAFQLAERATVQIPYTVAEPTYVYIYAATGTQAARSVGAARAAAAENSVKVYSYKWEPAEPTGISSVDNSQSATGNEAGDWYTIDGRKLSGKPAQKGIYIVNGRKVAVK